MVPENICPSRGRLLEILRESGVSTAKSMKLNWKFQGREDSNKTFFHERGIDVFWNHTFKDEESENLYPFEGQNLKNDTLVVGPKKRLMCMETQIL